MPLTFVLSTAAGVVLARVRMFLIGDFSPAFSGEDPPLVNLGILLFRVGDADRAPADDGARTGMLECVERLLVERSGEDDVSSLMGVSVKGSCVSDSLADVPADLLLGVCGMISSDGPEFVVEIAVVSVRGLFVCFSVFCDLCME